MEIAGITDAVLLIFNSIHPLLESLAIGLLWMLHHWRPAYYSNSFQQSRRAVVRCPLNNGLEFLSQGLWWAGSCRTPLD
jgi:hypothetical protein